MEYFFGFNYQADQVSLQLLLSETFLLNKLCQTLQLYGNLSMNSCYMVVHKALKVRLGKIKSGFLQKILSVFICLFTFVLFLSFSDTYMKLSCQEIPQKSVSQHGTSKKITNKIQVIYHGVLSTGQVLLDLLVRFQLDSFSNIFLTLT